MADRHIVMYLTARPFNFDEVWYTGAYLKLDDRQMAKFFSRQSRQWLYASHYWTPKIQDGWGSPSWKSTWRHIFLLRWSDLEKIADYTVVQKNAPTLADYNYDPVQSILIIFSKLFVNDRKSCLVVKFATSPHICCHCTLWNTMLYFALITLLIAKKCANFGSP